MIKFWVSGSPVAKGRARSSARGFHYTPAKTRRAEESLLAQALPHKPDEPLEGPVWLEVIFNLPIPQSKSKKWKKAAADGEELPLKKPDIDNLTKLVMDALNEVFWGDDKQLVGLLAFKRYSDKPGTSIGVMSHMEAKKYVRGQEIEFEQFSEDEYRVSTLEKSIVHLQRRIKDLENIVDKLKAEVNNAVHN